MCKITMTIEKTTPPGDYPAGVALKTTTANQSIKTCETKGESSISMALEIVKNNKKALPMT